MAPILGDLTQSEKLSEIKPHLVRFPVKKHWQCKHTDKNILKDFLSGSTELHLEHFRFFPKKEYVSSKCSGKYIVAPNFGYGVRDFKLWLLAFF